MSKTTTRAKSSARAKKGSTRAGKRSTRKKKQSKPLVSHQRKKEVFGLILMSLAVLLGLALLSYSPADDTLARALSFSDLFSTSAARANNALGLIGAFLAWMLVPSLLGFPVVLLTAVLFGWGYIVFRDRPPVRLPWLTVLAAFGSVLLACFLGWVGHTFELDTSLWSGRLGLGVSGGLVRALGTVGSFIILLVLTVVLLLLIIDRDIQRSIDRFEHAFEAVRTWLIRQQTIWTERWKAYRADRATRREAYLAEREARAQKREAARQKARSEALQKTTRPTSSSSTKAANPTSSPKRTTATPPPVFSPVFSPDTTEAQVLNDLYIPTPGDTSQQPTTSPPGASPSAKPTPPKPTPRPAAPVPDGSPSPAPNAEEEQQDGVEFNVRERVEEQKANFDERKPRVEVKTVPYAFPSVELLEDEEEGGAQIDFDELEEKKQLILDKLDMHKVQLSNVEAIVGPTVTLYELTPAPGIKISQIKSLENDLAMALAARGIRMIAPIPGKSAVGVEIPNRYRELVRIRSVLNTARFRDAEMELPIVLGKTIENEVFIQDLAKMPHLLIAGATGAGKSVGLNCLITCLLYACHPANLKFVMIDPKKIELPQYAQISDHFLAVPEDADEAITTDFGQAQFVLKSCLLEMEQRYDLLSKAGVRGVKDYNKRVRSRRLSTEEGHHHLPYLVIIIDELADLIMTAGKEIEGPIARLAQMARAVGIHMVIATQRPSVNVITGLIKANFPARIAYQVASGIDSRTIIDQYGAEQLVGNGDLLFMRGSQIKRLQSPFISLEEVEDVTAFIGDQSGAGPYLLPSLEDAGRPTAGDDSGSVSEDRDKLFEEAARIIVRSQQGSVSLLQRKLSVGYTRAARLVDQLEDAGIVGPFEGSKARQVLVADDLQLDEHLKALGV